MPRIAVNGVELSYELDGEGEPLVLVHGSWVDLNLFEPVASLLERSFAVLRYDRRGHGRSERPESQGSAAEDVADLAALLEALGLAPAHVAGISFGGTVALKLAAARPELVRTLAVHEPPLFDLLLGDPRTVAVADRVHALTRPIVAALEAGDHERAARLFVDGIAFAPGTWEREMRRGLRRMFLRNAPTFLDECRDPEALSLDLAALARFRGPALVSSGAQSPARFRPVADLVAATLPGARRVTVPGAGHAVQRDDPQRYAELLRELSARAQPASV